MRIFFTWSGRFAAAAHADYSRRSLASQARVFQNRPNIRQICLLGIAAFVCVYYKLRPVVAAYSAVALLSSHCASQKCALPYKQCSHASCVSRLVHGY